MSRTREASGSKRCRTKQAAETLMVRLPATGFRPVNAFAPWLCCGSPSDGGQATGTNVTIQSFEN